MNTVLAQQSFYSSHHSNTPISAGKAVRFQRGSHAWLEDGATWLATNLYDKGEGRRYLVEQTLGYTVPRTVQQLNRTKDITGDTNPMAAQEMLLRDLGADVLDTIAPGVLATYGIGQALDKAHHGQTWVRHHIGSEAMAFYESLAQGSQGKALSRERFLQNVEDALNRFARRSDKPVSLRLQQRLRQLQQNPQGLKEIPRLAQTIAQQLGLTYLDVTLRAGKTRELTLPLPDLIRDLSLMYPQSERFASTPQWGRYLTVGLQKTRQLSKYLLLANLVALIGSISLPFGIRLLTRLRYGEDAFPGTKELQEHFGKTSQRRKAQQNTRVSQRFEPFPYLKQSWQEGNYLPVFLTLGFFGILAGAVLRRVGFRNGAFLKAANWFKAYEFQRGFPFTSIPQMELTYGLLCGVRLAASRDEAEFRESGIRDCLLGWPTLTYFFPACRTRISQAFDRQLQRVFGRKHLLVKPNGEVRTREEINGAMFKAMGAASQAVDAAHRKHSVSTLISAAISWLLLAFLEPKLGIMLTNHLALNRFKTSDNPSPSPDLCPAFKTSSQGLYPPTGMPYTSYPSGYHSFQSLSPIPFSAYTPVAFGPLYPGYHINGV